jgi:hypothetical protein
VVGLRRGFPPSVIARLGGVDPAELANQVGIGDIDRIALQPAPGWMVRTWRGDVAAMTLPWAIYVRQDVLGGDSLRLARLVSHELVHVKQWQQLGTSRFLVRYMRDYLRGRRRGLSHHQAYLAISLEKEARELSGH